MGKYVSNRRQVEATLSEAIRARLTQLADIYERDLQEQFRSPKHGRLYGHAQALRRFAKREARIEQGADAAKLRKVGGVHRASAPGEAPARDTSALAKSITRRIERIGKMNWRVSIGVNMQGGRGAPTGSNGKSIAEDLEFGTSKMEARPAWRPALERLRLLIARTK